MRTAIICAALMALTATSAGAVDPTQENMVNALGETASETQECAAYFVVTSVCFKDVAPDEARQYQEAANRIGELAWKALRTTGMSDEALKARHLMMGEQMMADMKKNCTNVAVLQRRYAKFCKALSAGTDWRLMQWFACKQAKQRSCAGGPVR